MMIKIRIYYCSIILFILSVNTAFLQSPEIDSPKKKPLHSLIWSIGDDVWKVASSPLRLDENERLQFISFAALNMGIMFSIDGITDKDFTTNELSGSDQPQGIWKPAEQLADVGDLYDRIGPQKILLGLSAGFFTGGLIFRNNKHLQTSRLLIESYVITETITFWGKGILGRARPYAGEGPLEFEPLEFSSSGDFRSLPSGHSSGVFAMMSVLAGQYRKWWITYPAYILAVSVALQRMDDRQHWLSDVVLGGGLGYWVGSRLVNYNNERNKTVSVKPFVNKGLMGVVLSYELNSN